MFIARTAAKFLTTFALTAAAFLSIQGSAGAAPATCDDMHWKCPTVVSQNGAD